ncbi:MAG: carboxypeptidase regulatory-like domain-containing protein [Planctomycetes bacterium]|nr:carboxypeptidase regulatory-like domain-containing protein [Planctomycetota bacterium]
MGSVLYVLAALLLGAVGLVLWQPDPGPPPVPPRPAAAGPAADGAGPEAVYRAPAGQAGQADHERRTETDDAPPWATVQGQLTKPAWASYPSDMVLRLEPQGAGDAEGYTVLMHPGKVFFRFDRVPYGNWRLELMAAGFRHDPQLITVTPQDPHRHLLVALQPDRVIRGRVSTADGSPAAGALVTATRVAEPGRAVLPLTAESDERGEFAITGARPGPYQVYLGPSRSPIGPPVQISFAPEAREAWVELSLPPTGAAVVTVQVAASGAAVAGVRLTATRVSPGLPGHVAAAASGQDGRCRFAHLPVGEYAFQSVSSRHRSGTVRATVLEGGQAEVVLAVTVR